MAAKFVKVRIIRITGVDLNLFNFDFDNTWAAFLMNAEGKIYGRYGGRDAKGAEGRLTLAGLRYAMEKALAEHQKNPTVAPIPPLPLQPQFAEHYPAAKKAKGCIHCHQIHEFQRDLLKKSGKWDPDWRWLYPLPENVGITLDLNQGDLVKAVKPESPAAKVGLQPGDVVQSLNGIALASFADAQYGLHLAPAKGSIPIVWKRGAASQQGTLQLAQGWRKSNITWRPSLLDIMPAMPLYGEDLTPAEKQALNLPPKHLAFYQDKIVAAKAKEAGVKAGDVIIGIDGLQLEMEMVQFLGYVRQNYLAGDPVTLNLFRDGKRLDLPLKLPW